MRLAERDERVVAITAAMTQGTGLEAFERRFPDRFYDVGIAEEHAAVFAAGLAIGGMRPVVALYSTFLQRAFDMLVQDIGLQHLPVMFAVDRAGLVGDDGPTHHGAFDLSFLRVIPDITVMAPSSQEELQRMLRTALDTRRPGGAPLPARPGGAVRAARRARAARRWGAAWCSQEGGDVALVGIGTGVGIAREAAALLAAQGEQPTVVDARFVKPLDDELLQRLAAAHTPPRHRRGERPRRRVRQRRRSRLVGEHACEVVRFGLPDAFVPHGDRGALLPTSASRRRRSRSRRGARSPALARVK